ncbi:NAD(P)/FAD-dependent oxidoreductase [Psychrobacter arenosus]|uniref:NAD(P)/FAD-dependent oxidoreductase n=1 Tax=Psychrobacter arenosus TaxID=256326 RepID=UPI001D1002C7|nr:FAD-dependent oxidoreductase [Psychrobacter arenosus]
MSQAAATSMTSPSTIEATNSSIDDAKNHDSSTAHATTTATTNATATDSLSDSSELQLSNTLAADAGVVIIGAGMAGSRLAIELARAWQFADTNDAPSITLISKEPQVGYNRIMLSPVLAGEKEFDTTYLYNKSDYEALGVHVIAGVAVVSIDTHQQRLTLDDGQVLSYTKLVFATGSTAKVIPFPNHDAKAVHVFRDLADVTALTEYAKQGKTGLVIGGGVLGLEAACALAKQGGKMTVIHVDGYVLNQQLDLPAAKLLQAELARRDVGLEVSAMSKSIEVNDAGEVTGLIMNDGRRIPADFIVMAVGVVPNTVLAQDSGIEVNRGIVVDDCMHASVPNVYAIGECVELNEELFGMVAPVNQQVDTLVTVLSSSKESWQPYVSKPLSLKLKVSGVSVFSAGKIAFDEAERDEVETIVYRQPDSDHYQCLYIKDNKLVGAVLYGEVTEGSFYSQLITEQTDITTIKDDLIYGEAYCDLETLQKDHLATDRPIQAESDSAKNNNTLAATDSADEASSEQLKEVV